MDIAENNLVRFISISKKKDGMFANFRVKGMKGSNLQLQYLRRH